MTTIEDDDYLRISLLLLKGGGMVSENILNREVKKSRDSIDRLLRKSEQKCLYLSEKQIKLLYPSRGTTHIEDWDIQMFTAVLLNVFEKGLDEDSKKAIRFIQYVRNAIHAHRPSKPSKSHSDYEYVRIKLVDALKFLSSKLDSTIRQKCTDVITKCTESRLDATTVKQLLEGVSSTEEVANEILNRFDQMSNEVKQTIEEQHQKTRNDNVENTNIIVDKLDKLLLKDPERSKQKIFTVLDTKLTLTVVEGQHELGDEAEKILKSVFEVAIKKTGSTEYPLVMQAVNEFIKEIESTGAEVQQVKPKCILMTFVCKSYESLLNLLLYLESEAYTKSLSKIVDAVCSILPLEKPIYLRSRLMPESLKDILNSIVESQTLYSRTVELPIKVTSLGGMAKVYNLFESGGATNSFNKVSEAISSHLGAKIKLKPSLNVEQVGKELICAHTNELSTSVIEEKYADHVSSKDTGCEDFDSRKTLPSSRSPETYKEEEADEKYATPRKDMKKDKKGLENIEEIGETEKHDQDQDIEEHLFPSSDQEMADKNLIFGTNELFSSLRLEKSREYEPSTDSGFDDVASSKAWSSSSQSVASEEEKEYENEISIGMSVGMQTQTRDSMSSVGPFVSIEGMHSKCFITFGPSRKAIAYTINSRQRHLKVLAHSFKTNGMLVALDEAESSRGKDGDLGSELWIQADTGFLTDGTKVFKVGVSGYTEGVISNKMPFDKRTDMFIMVESLPGPKKRFANPGDAGSAVFCKIEDKVCCIGIVIGSIAQEGYTCIAVKKIDNVLTDLQNVYGKQISLDKCEMNSQLSKIPQVKEFIEIE